jgi:monoamine oxidase
MARSKAIPIDPAAHSEYRARSSIPVRISWMEFARQGILAAYSSRLNPYALHPKEYELLRNSITRTQVTTYLGIRNAVLRLWHRNPMVAVTKHEAAGCAREPRHFDLALVAYEWLQRNGYINFGCVDVSSLAPDPSKTKLKAGRRKTIVVIGAGMSGLGCARQIESLVQQLGEKFYQQGVKSPRIVVLEGRHRIGGRVYSHPLRNSRDSTLKPGMRNTVEMGAQIITGFEHGNPLNFLVRGQLGLPYHALRDDSILYDCDGRTVDKDMDIKIERLWNDVLERAAVFRNKGAAAHTVEGDRSLIMYGEDAKEHFGDEDDRLLSDLEAEGIQVATAENDHASAAINNQEHASAGVEKLAGRQYQHAGATAKFGAAQTAQILGFETSDAVTAETSINLDPISKSSPYPTLGETMDEGIRQYQELLNLTPQDLRLLNWHHANLEYANAVNVNDLSLGGWDQDIGNEFEGEHCVIIGGYTQVPRGLWRVPTTLDVRFGHTVRRVKYTDKQRDRGDPILVECENGESFHADELIMTTPLGVLKQGSIKFEPPLPDWKTSCIERMGFGLLNKVVLVYEKAFWEQDRDIFGLLNSPDENSTNQKDYSSNRGRFYLFWNLIPTTGRPALTALMAGTAAHHTEITSDAALVDEVTARLRQVFAPKEVPSPSEVIVTRWKQDPYARGTYSYVGPKTLQGDYDIMSRPCGPIHFAGEATCGTHPATVHGAYISGLRAASEVIDSLLGPMALEPGRIVAAKIKTEHATPKAALSPDKKRKKGYVEIWEPVNKPPDSFTADRLHSVAVNDYEGQVMAAIRAEVGDRPQKPTKTKLNPFILYQKDEWPAMKAECDAKKAAATGKPDAKASRDEIRVAVGAKWRGLPENLKKPYLDRCKDGRDGTAGAMAEYEAGVKVWDQEAARIRGKYAIEHPPPDNYDPLGSGRKVRKLSYNV